MNKPILVTGGGVVGLRVTRAFLHAGYETELAINSIREDNPRTKQVKDLVADFPEMKILSTATRPELTRNEAALQGIRITNTLESKLLSNYQLIIDCAHKQGTIDNYINMYSKSDVPVIVQGASAYDMFSNDFVMEQNTVGFDEPERFRGKSCKKVSCNATYTSLMLGTVLSKFDADQIKKAEIYLFRRQQDPEDRKEEVLESTELDYGTPGIGTKHSKDITNCIPSLEGKIKTYANKNPWRHYHRINAEIEFENELSEKDVESLKYAFRDNARCIYLEDDPGNNSTEQMNKVTSEFIKFFETKLGIPDGDCYLGIYSLEQTDTKQILITGYNPQRSIVALNHLDYLHLMQGLSAEDAWNKTNRLPVIYGNLPSRVKLETEHYFNKQ